MSSSAAVSSNPAGTMSCWRSRVSITRCGASRLARSRMRRHPPRCFNLFQTSVKGRIIHVTAPNVTAVSSRDVWGIGVLGPLKAEPKLSLECPMSPGSGALDSDHLTEVAGERILTVQSRRIGHDGVIQHIVGISTDLNALRFRDSECLAGVGVEIPSGNREH